MRNIARKFKPKSIQYRFLLYFSLAFIAYLTGALVLFGLINFERDRDQLIDRMSHLAVTQSAVLSSSLWHLDHDRIDAILNAVTAEPAAKKVTVRDEFNNVLSSVSQYGTKDGSDIFTITEPITYITDGKSRKIGEFELEFSDARLRANIQRRLAVVLAFGFLLFLGVLAIVHFVNRYVIIAPVLKLAEAVNAPRAGGKRMLVEWDTDDELGALIRSFNEMQQREQAAEEQLIESRDRLEARVRERTAALEAALAEAERANRSKSEFLATMSHELRTPLNAIIGFSNVIENGYFGPIGSAKYIAYAQDIHKSGLHLLSLIDDILDISAIEAGKRTYEMAAIDVRATVEESLREIEIAAVDKNIQLHTDIPNGIRPVFADERSIRQILVNLLSNAVKFTDVGGDIEISVDDLGEVHEICVKDNGIGIDKNNLTNIVEPFSQAISNPHLSREGFGLGLSIVKDLIEIHHGVMNIHSATGEGTTVIVRIPNHQ